MAWGEPNNRHKSVWEMDDWQQTVATRDELIEAIHRLRDEFEGAKQERDHLHAMLKGEAIHSDLEARKRAVDAEARAEEAERELEDRKKSEAYHYERHQAEHDRAEAAERERDEWRERLSLAQDAAVEHRGIYTSTGLCIPAHKRELILAAVRELRKELSTSGVEASIGRELDAILDGEGEEVSERDRRQGFADALTHAEARAEAAERTVRRLRSMLDASDRTLAAVREKLGEAVFDNTAGGLQGVIDEALAILDGELEGETAPSYQTRQRIRNRALDGEGE